MAKGEAVHSSHTSPNQTHSIVGVIGTLGTADTGGTALTLPIAVKEGSGALMIHISGTDVDIGGGGGTFVNIATGTQQTLGTLGTNEGIGTITNIGVIHSAGTVEALPDIPGGTIDLVTSVSNLASGTIAMLHAGTLSKVTEVSNVLNIDEVGEVFKLGTLNKLETGTIQLVSNLAGGTITALAKGTISAGTVNVTAFGADIPGGTIDLVTAVSSVSNLVKGTVTSVETLPDLPGGTVDLITTVSSLSAGTVGHNISGVGDGVKTVTTAGSDEALAGSTTAKRVTIQAQTDNTGLIAVGATGVDATEATGTGIILFAGDSITMMCDNLADIFIDATVNGEGVRFTFLT